MVAETYVQMKSRHEKEFNEYTKNCVFFAFSMDQFNQGMKKIGLNPTDTDKIYKIGAGGFILREKSKDYNELLFRFAEEHTKAIENDADGTGFIRQMFEYEMNNHEYGYTRDLTDTLDALSFTTEEIEKDKRLQNGLSIARKAVLEWYDKHN